MATQQEYEERQAQLEQHIMEAEQALRAEEARYVVQGTRKFQVAEAEERLDYWTWQYTTFMEDPERYLAERTAR